ncbi:hypothetical protein OG921_19030 [Aldersonia sp. NBC_00410]|uniref:hypothetical protein n=1 Tax=Aldersonia sp. NBC_00410 TaxID=2975954 RepID=UPI0022571B34|nr:hypothetical protein [Aldersonia sp. NBC_00410]MCX5045264.1 hypothetical protein [Aldersonia sp. NBC_00410]
MTDEPDRAGTEPATEAVGTVASGTSQVGPGPESEEDSGAETAPLVTEVEVTLLDLGVDLEDLFDDYLEAFNPHTGELAASDTAGEAVLGMRMCYRAQYDFETDTGDHWVDSPARSDPPANRFKRIPRSDRAAVPTLFIEPGLPFQVRAEGAFRELIANADSTGLDDALAELDRGVREATQRFSRTDPVSYGSVQVIESGASDLLGVTSADEIELVADDGSLAGLLRSFQPAISLDHAGVLPLRSHGSTAQSVLSTAEAISATSAMSGELVVLADDFGDGLDAPASEHLAYLLQKASNQVILTTRRPEVVRAFAPEQLLRLTRSHGRRRQHRLNTADKRTRIVRRLALDQLLAALTSRTVALLEGPLDVEGYGTLAARLAKKTGSRQHSLPANGIRLVCPPGSDGGITRLKGLAELAVEMGFHVKAVVDSDKPGASDSVIVDLLNTVEQVIVLPTRTAVEAALIRGVPARRLRATVAALQEGVGFPSLPADLPDAEVAKYLIDKKILKTQGLHVLWAQSVTARPPVACAVIEALCNDGTGRFDVPDAT